MTNVRSWDVAKGEGRLETVGSFDAGTGVFTTKDVNLTRLVQGVASFCGDGTVKAGVEACDDGNTLDGDGCSASCTVETTHACLHPDCGSSTCTLVSRTFWSDWQAVAALLAVMLLVMIVVWVVYRLCVRTTMKLDDEEEAMRLSTIQLRHVLQVPAPAPSSSAGRDGAGW